MTLREHLRHTEQLTLVHIILTLVLAFGIGLLGLGQMRTQRVMRTILENEILRSELEQLKRRQGPCRQEESPDARTFFEARLHDGH